MTDNKQMSELKTPFSMEPSVEHSGDVVDVFDADGNFYFSLSRLEAEAIVYAVNNSDDKDARIKGLVDLLKANKLAMNVAREHTKADGMNLDKMSADNILRHNIELTDKYIKDGE